jgi:hypothetical protein
MTEALRSYRSLELRLWDARWRHAGDESPEEDAILDEMDQVWLRLSEDERNQLREEGPRCWPMDPACWPPGLCPSGISTPRAWPYEGFRSPEEAILSARVA